MPRYSRTPAGVLVTDDPWTFDDSLGERGAEAHYEGGVLALEQIAAFPLPPLQRDCVLFMWRVAGANEELSLAEAAYRIARIRGFVPRSEIVWRKLSKNGLPLDEDPEAATGEAFGLGHYVRNMHEVCLICTRGNPMLKDRAVRSVFSAPLGEHSEKPDAFYNLVERMYDGPSVELFARKRRRGWISYGDELR